MSELRARVEADMKAALKGGDRERLGTLRLVLAAIKQREIDERIALDDAGVMAVLEKMVKQRRESIAQYETAGRTDLVAVEAREITIIQGYLPEPLSETEIRAMVETVIAETGAASVKDMGKVIGQLKARLAGRADMGAVSALVKARLAG